MLYIRKVARVAKPLYEEKLYDYVDGLMEDVLASVSMAMMMDWSYQNVICQGTLQSMTNLRRNWLLGSTNLDLMAFERVLHLISTATLNIGHVLC